ncbi:MAG: CRISPR-associated endonuclease Cas2 [Planctomycetes bacterium]|nr:CRISPR-associated endonuclease Cas2 [Planctomycetota bacterium]
MEHLYIISYDISDPKRLRRVFRIMKGYGEWLQLSVFQCRLTRMRMVQLESDLSDAMNQRDDHVLIVDVGPAEEIRPRVRSLGKAFEAVRREAVIV